MEVRVGLLSRFWLCRLQATNTYIDIKRLFPHQAGRMEVRKVEVRKVEVRKVESWLKSKRKSRKSHL